MDWWHGGSKGTLPSGQTSLLNTIGQNEPKGSQLQLTMNAGKDKIPSDNDSNESYLPQTDGTYNYDDAMYEKNYAVDPNKCNQPTDEKNCAVDAVDPNNYAKGKNYNVPENEQIHVTDGAMNTNHILHNVESDANSEVEFEITHEDSEDQEIKLVFQRDVDKYFLASLWAKYLCCVYSELFYCEKCEDTCALS